MTQTEEVMFELYEIRVFDRLVIILEHFPKQCKMFSDKPIVKRTLIQKTDEKIEVFLRALHHMETSFDDQHYTLIINVKILVRRFRLELSYFFGITFKRLHYLYKSRSI